MKYDELIEKFLHRIEDILYKENKYDDEDMANLIVSILEDDYDI